MQKITGSIVTYNPDWPLLREAIVSFLAVSPAAEVRIWDNSPESFLRHPLEQLVQQTFPERVIYTRSPQNIGFGAGHNHNLADCTSDYFCLLNPDVKLTPTALVSLVKYAEQNTGVGLVSCSILNPDGSEQKVHKFLPSFSHYVALILKRLLRRRETDTHSPQNLPRGSTSNLPLLSGCFMLFKREHYRELNGFDERFFLYFEDYDLSLRSFLMNKSVILNDISVIHFWQRASHKSWRLFFVHLLSGIKFYSKWGFTKRLSHKVNKMAAERTNRS